MKLATCKVRVGPEGARIEPAKRLGAWWVQFGDEVLLYAANRSWPSVLKRAGREDILLDEFAGEVRKRDMYLVVQNGRLFQQHYPEVPVLIDKGRFLGVELTAEWLEKVEPMPSCFGLEPLLENHVVFDVRPAGVARRAPATWVQNMVNKVARSNYEAVLTDLVVYPTRYSTTNHFTNAATLARQKFDNLGYSTQIDTITISGSTSRNVVADKAGSGRGPRDLVLVVAHLDSINAGNVPNGSAPGADDNGSGSAGVLEMARVFKKHTARHDLRFVLFGGEEQGLKGSSQYIASLSASEQGRINAVINMDMIGSQNTTLPTVLLEGAVVSQSVINNLAQAAADHTSLTVQTSLSPYASDHVSFINAGLPGVLTIEGSDSANSLVHTAGDTITHIDYDLALEIVRMNVAAVASAIGKSGGLQMNEYFELGNEYKDLELAPNVVAVFQHLGKLSGRYTYNGGFNKYLATAAIANKVAWANPVYKLDKPIYLEDNTNGFALGYLSSLRFTLHIDIDGSYPLDVVSGVVGKGFFVSSTPAHFIGQVTSSSWTGGVCNLVVENFSFTWPGSSNVINRLEIAVSGGIYAQSRSAEVTFLNTAGGASYGPYTSKRQSTYFRDVEVEVDTEDGAVTVEPYNTHTHPDRPSDIISKNLNLENVFGWAGIKVRRSSHGNVINTSEAGTDNRWSYSELHDSMDDHWSAFANIPQWKMWVFLAELGSSDSLGGAMFDGNIDEPGGVDRQGTAIFTTCPWFHTTAGGYITANPPEAEAVKRELFFNLVHESGHAFNLYHSFAKTSATPWTPPSWMPLASDSNALSFMNYPEQPSPGYNATWFYDRFYFRFSDDEHLFLRHAPERYVRMGAEDWGQNHGRVARDSLDPRLQLVVRNLKKSVELGEPVFVELRLRNVSNEIVSVIEDLDPSEGMVELAVTNPRGERKPFLPFIRTRSLLKSTRLEPGDSIYVSANITMGLLGFSFKESGPYRIEASYQNADGGTAAAVMQLWVRPPANYDGMGVISELFNARVGRVIQVGGSRTMVDVNEKLDWICGKLGAEHPATFYLKAVRGMPLATPFKVLNADSDKLKLLAPEPELTVNHLKPMIDMAEAAANAIGHIEYQRVVDLYTKSAVDAKKGKAALAAQEQLLRMYKKRGVIESVIKDIEKRVIELKDK